MKLILEVLKTVAHDNGMVNRIQGEPRWSLPPRWLPLELAIEDELEQLTDEEFYDLCQGEELAQLDAARKAPLTDQMLFDFIVGNWK